MNDKTGSSVACGRPEDLCGEHAGGGTDRKTAKPRRGGELGGSRLRKVLCPHFMDPGSINYRAGDVTKP